MLAFVYVHVIKPGFAATSSCSMGPSWCTYVTDVCVCVCVKHTDDPSHPGAGLQRYDNTLEILSECVSVCELDMAPVREYTFHDYDNQIVDHNYMGKLLRDVPLSVFSQTHTHTISLLKPGCISTLDFPDFPAV